MGSEQEQSPRGDASSAHEFHSRYLTAYLDSAHAAAKAQLALQLQVAQVYSEFQQTVAELGREVQERGIQAFQRYADDLGAAAEGGDASKRCRDAYEAYVDAVRQLGAAQTDAERAAMETYNQYTSALAEQRDEAEIREKAEAAQSAHLAAVRSRYEKSDVRQRAEEAEQQLARLLQEAQTENQQLVTSAVDTYQKALTTALDQSDVQRRYQAALQSCRERLGALRDQTTRVLMDVQLKSLAEMRQAWEQVGGPAR